MALVESVDRLVTLAATATAHLERTLALATRLAPSLRKYPQIAEAQAWLRDTFPEAQT